MFICKYPALTLSVVSMSPLCIPVLSNSRAKVEAWPSRRCCSRCEKEGSTGVGLASARPGSVLLVVV